MNEYKIKAMPKVREGWNFLMELRISEYECYEVHQSSKSPRNKNDDKDNQCELRKIVM